MLKSKQPIGTKIYEFQPKSRSGGQRGEPNFLDPLAYSQLATSEAVQEQVMNVLNAVPSQQNHKRSIENLLKFLDLNN